MDGDRVALRREVNLCCQSREDEEAWRSSRRPGSDERERSRRGQVELSFEDGYLVGDLPARRADLEGGVDLFFVSICRRCAGRLVARRWSARVAGREGRPESGSRKLTERSSVSVDWFGEDEPYELSLVWTSEEEGCPNTVESLCVIGLKSRHYVSKFFWKKFN